MKHLIGTAVGAAIDRGDGDSGIKGAILGYAVSGALKIVAKPGGLVAIAAGALPPGAQGRQPARHLLTPAAHRVIAHSC